MAGKHTLEGGMIPRSVKRMFDERSEPREETDLKTAMLGYRGASHVVRLVNISQSGAMVIFDQMPHIGEKVTLQLLEQGEVAAVVRWVRGGSIGINFVD
ncbi:PilZ domain-containing protein [Sphingomicrobium flavum]|uniref:PilZ domain-containing protein n=1 Tax=Sphingomicrobium flavum TaxID=1229164 RepID=UPI0021AE0DCD|nr:PilZ domain-containing protein [Sphingomicrobium flavum]